MLAEQTTDPPLDHLRAVVRREDVLMAIEAARVVYVEESVNRYVVALLAHTRAEPEARARGEPSRRHRAPAHGEGACGRGGPGLRPAGRRAGSRAWPCSSHRVIVAPEARAAGTLGRRGGAGGARPRPGSRHEARRRACCSGLRHRSPRSRSARARSAVAGVGLLLAAARRARLGRARAGTRLRRPCRRSRLRRPKASAFELEDRSHARLAHPGGLARRTRLARPARRVRVPSARTRPRRGRRSRPRATSSRPLCDLGLRASSSATTSGSSPSRWPSIRRARRSSCIHGSSSCRRCSATRGGWAEPDAGCSCDGRPASTSTRCVSTRRASRCAACTGRRPRAVGS